MTVAAILAGKGRDVATTTAAKTVADAVAALARRKIGALVVVEDGDRIVGIISERDIVRAIAASAGAALTEPVSAIMTKTVVTFDSGGSFGDDRAGTYRVQGSRGEGDVG